MNNNALWHLTLFPSYFADSKREGALTTPELTELLKRPHAAEKAGLPMLSAQCFGDVPNAKGSLKYTDNLVGSWGVIGDYDAELLDPEEAIEKLHRHDIEAIIHTSPSHRPEAPRWRVIALYDLLVTPFDAAKHIQRASWLNGALGGVLASESRSSAQGFYYGSIIGGHPVQVWFTPGRPLNQCRDLASIAIGTFLGKAKTGQKAREPGKREMFDQAELLRQIIDSEQFKDPALSLLGFWARHEGAGVVEAERRLHEAFDAVAEDKKDAGWQQRRDAIPRLIELVYGREWDRRQREQAALGDLKTRSGPAPTSDNIEPDPHEAEAGSADPKVGAGDDDFPGDRASQAQRHWGDGANPSFRDPWNDPMSPEWPSGVLPPRLHDMLFEISLRDGLDPGSQGMSLLAAASGAAPKNLRFLPYIRSKWRVPPIIWLMIINFSGQRKTALLYNAFTALRERHAEVWRDYMADLAAWRADPEAKKSDKPEEPHSYYTVDTSPEALQVILAKDERGTLLVRDELAGFFDFGRYARGQGAAERAFYLESYEAGPYTVYRLTRDSLYIAVNGLTVYGHIQPDRLKAFAGLEDDGLLQRFITIRGATAGAGRLLDVEAQDDFDEIINALTSLDGDDLTYRTTTEGSEIIRQMERDGTEYATLTDYGIGFQGFAGKLHGTLARVALLLHLIDDPCAKLAHVIPTSTIARADRLVRRFILLHAVDFYANLSPDRIERTRAIAAWLLTGSPVRLRASDFAANVHACRGLKLPQLNEALDPLVTGGWLIPTTPFPSNREWTLVVEVRTALAARQAAAAARREDIRQLWEKIASERRGGGIDAENG